MEQAATAKTESTYVDRLKRLLNDVSGLVQQRSACEAQIDQQHAARDGEIVRDYQRRRETLIADFEAAVTRLRSEYQKRREETIYNYESNSYAVVEEAEQFEQLAAAEHERGQQRIKRLWQVARRAARDEFREAKDRPQWEFDRFQRRCKARLEEFDALVQQLNNLLRRRGCSLPDELPTPLAVQASDPLSYAQERLLTAQHHFDQMRRQPAARFLEEGWPFLIFLFTALAIAGPAVWWQDWTLGLTAAVILGAVSGWLVRCFVRPRAQRQTLSVLPELLQAVAEAQVNLAAAVRQARETADHTYEELVERREQTISDAHARWSRARVETAAQHQESVRKASERFKLRRMELKEIYQRDLKALDQQYPPQIQAREEAFAAASQTLLEQRQQLLDASQGEAAQRWQELVCKWACGLDGFETEIDQMNAFCQQHFPTWASVDWRRWEPAEEDLPALRFGTLRFRLDDFPGGVSGHELLDRQRIEFALPAVLSYPTCPSLLYLGQDEGREVAVRSLQNVMLRLLTALPPGKVRFTIIDPTGLGQNFSAFMHLADFDERLVASRIWTEVGHIQKRLADLTEHMENVIQKYLRNEFDSIQQSIRPAGEVAEPFQILVIANFPANFNEESARRLISIAASGARCGVYTLISVDSKLKLPQNFDLADLQSGAAVLRWDASARSYRWQDDLLSGLPLTLDPPPGDDRFTGIVRAIGERAKDASRVEVPFVTVVPPQDQWWTSDSRAEIAVPLGRAGATNLQCLRLGRGTSQHVLVAGKTGSGKSTLLHALITNLAIHYSPDEVQFYLIDFKKGVEFKAYAALSLPHARVIAIESEREFGMSVLQRLDLELKHRGDLFRRQGVQDLKAYRNAHPGSSLPRLLLIIDEFQEFFVKDDRIAQEAALLLDRLVRQGRAFGIHVLLGSQTLAGAYTLARSTLGQMAVRIALQCSETDAHLILSDDNTAARLLSRPGEAIYNDANGLFEGNHPFQVVWLPDHEREHYLERLAEMAERRQVRLPPPIVFEGNAPADPAKNELLSAAWEAGEPAGRALAPRAWLGEAVAIKDPAAAVFHRQSGSNLLVVGQDESLALGVLATCLISLAAELKGFLSEEPGDAAMAGELPPEEGYVLPLFPGAHFLVLDGQRAESPTAGFWSRLAAQLPVPIRVAGPSEAPRVLAPLAEEVQRRLAENADAAPPIFLVVHYLPRFRELRKGDDFNFSFDPEAAAGLDKQLSTILREGPQFGVHTILWCDTSTNLNRWLDRQSINDLAWRVLFQMSATDSANLMDGPDASRLGMHRAVLYNDEQGEAEKFRPYGLPSADWLAWIKSRLTRRLTEV